MTAPLVSVIVPCFNAAPWIAVTLESVLGQTHRRIEAIVVDDGSTDRSAEIVAAHADDRVRLIQQSHRGAPAARNRGLAHAAGDYIQFLDADDLLGPTKVEAQLQALHTVGAGDKVAVCGWGRFVDEPSRAGFRPEPVWRDQSGLDFLVAAALHDYMFPLHAWLVPHRVCGQTGGWNERLLRNQDGEFFSRVLTLSDGIVFCDRARVYYRSGMRGSCSSRSDRAAAESELLAWHLIAATMCAREDSQRVRRAVATGYQRLHVRFDGRFPDIAAEAARHEQRYGRGVYKFSGGPLFMLIGRVFGWNTALRLRRLKRRALPQGSAYSIG